MNCALCLSINDLKSYIIEAKPPLSNNKAVKWKQRVSIQRTCTVICRGRYWFCVYSNVASFCHYPTNVATFCCWLKPIVICFVHEHLRCHYWLVINFCHLVPHVWTFNADHIYTCYLLAAETHREKYPVIARDNQLASTSTQYYTARQQYR